MITSFVDLVDPKLTGAVAFTIRDQLARTASTEGVGTEQIPSSYAGTIEGREASSSRSHARRPEGLLMPRPWWEVVPRSEWTEEDYKGYWAEGSPRIPSPPPPEQEIGKALPPPPPGPPLSSGFRLFSKPSRRERRCSQPGD